MKNFAPRTNYEQSRLQTAEDLGVPEFEILCPTLASVKFGITPERIRLKFEKLGGFKHRGRVFFRRAVVEKYVPPPKREKKIELRPGQTARKCLRCEQPFPSWGVGNRMCDNCKAFAARCI